MPLDEMGVILYNEVNKINKETMGYIYNTPIGRSVSSQREYYEDLILKVLYDAYYGLFSDSNIPISLRLLSQTVGLDGRKTKAICDYLIVKKYVQNVQGGSGPFYKISPEGIRFVEISQR